MQDESGHGVIHNVKLQSESKAFLHTSNGKAVAISAMFKISMWCNENTVTACEVSL